MKRPADEPAAARYDAIVIGGGVNGLTCAAMLGQAGLRTLLLEQRDAVGGCAAEHELAPGFRVPTLAHRTGPLRADVVEQLHLTQCGLRLTPQPIRYSALSPDGRALPVFADTALASEAIRAWSPRDAEAWPDFTRSLARLGHVIGSLFTRVSPDMDDPGTHDLWTLMRTARAFRALPKDDAWRLLRWGPMAVADLVSECLETELLRATVAADGLLGAMLGPWSAGSGLQLLMHEANAAVGVTRDADVVGGPAAVAAALRRAAERHGVDVRTGVTVKQVLVRADRAVGVALESGETFAVALGGLGRGPEAHLPVALRGGAPAARVPVADPEPARARDAGQGQSRPVGAAGVCRRDAADAGQPRADCAGPGVSRTRPTTTRSTVSGHHIPGSSSPSRRSPIRHSRRRARMCCRRTCSGYRQTATAQTADGGGDGLRYPVSGVRYTAGT